MNELTVVEALSLSLSLSLCFSNTCFFKKLKIWGIEHAGGEEDQRGRDSENSQGQGCTGRVQGRASQQVEEEVHSPVGSRRCVQEGEGLEDWERLQGPPGKGQSLSMVLMVYVYTREHPHESQGLTSLATDSNIYVRGAMTLK